MVQIVSVCRAAWEKLTQLISSLIPVRVRRGSGSVGGGSVVTGDSQHVLLEVCAAVSEVSECGPPQWKWKRITHSCMSAKRLLIAAVATDTLGQTNTRDASRPLKAQTATVAAATRDVSFIKFWILMIQFCVACRGSAEECWCVSEMLHLFAPGSTWLL